MDIDDLKEIGFGVGVFLGFMGVVVFAGFLLGFLV